jgi:hypothetical protein
MTIINPKETEELCWRLNKTPVAICSDAALFLSEWMMRLHQIKGEIQELYPKTGEAKRLKDKILRIIEQKEKGDR